MCLEDLRLGKGRTATPPGYGIFAAAPADLLKADSRRVAILFTFYGDVDQNIGAGPLDPDYVVLIAEQFGDALPVATLTAFNSQLLMRIEDYGQIVMGKWRYQIVVTTLGNQAVTALPIISTVNVEPLAHIPPVQQR